MAKDKRKKRDDEPRIYSATPRGIGKNWGACMVCGGKDQDLQNDCAFFVPSRETGEAIVAMFKQGAKLDYRDFEPHWVQVKITACDEHLSRLEMLISETMRTDDRLDGPGMSAELIKIVTN